MILKIAFRRAMGKNETNYVKVYFSYKNQNVFSNLNTDDDFITVHQEILSKVQKWLGEGSA